MKPHKSEPFNPSIANAFYRAGYIEAWGRGIQKICESCRELGTAEPEYTVQGDTLGGKILALLKEKPSITQKEIAVQFDISVPSVKRNMKKLLESGRIVRKGGKRFGYWKIN